MNFTQIIALDDSGSPGSDDLFVVGGCSFRLPSADLKQGKERLEAKWRELEKSRELAGVKGRKITAAQYAAVTDFIVSNDGRPVVVFSQLSSSEREAFASACSRISVNTAPRILGMKLPHLLWFFHVHYAAFIAAANVIILDGPPQRFQLAIDRTTLVNNHLPLARTAGCGAVTEALNSIKNTSPDFASRSNHHAKWVFERTAAASVPDLDDVSYDSRGPLNHIADIVASTCRRLILREADESMARSWSSLRERTTAHVFHRSIPSVPYDATDWMRDRFQNLDQALREIEERIASVPEPVRT